MFPGQLMGTVGGNVVSTVTTTSSSEHLKENKTLKHNVTSFKLMIDQLVDGIGSGRVDQFLSSVALYMWFWKMLLHCGM